MVHIRDELDLGTSKGPLLILILTNPQKVQDHCLSSQKMMTSRGALTLIRLIRLSGTDINKLPSSTHPRGTQTHR